MSSLPMEKWVMKADPKILFSGLRMLVMFGEHVNVYPHASKTNIDNVKVERVRREGVGSSSSACEQMQWGGYQEIRRGISYGMQL